MALTKEDLQAIRALMQEENAPIRADIANIKGDVATLKADMAHHNHYVEPLLKAVKDGVDGLQERNKQLDTLDNKVDDHDHRIWALEQKAI